MRVRRDQLVLGAVAAALLVAIVVFAASTTVNTRPARVAPTATPASERALFGGSLEPGVRYRTRAFAPPLSFVAGDGEWLVVDATEIDNLALQRRIRSGEPGGELPSRSGLVFTRINQVVDPESRRPLPVDDLHAFLKGHPDFVVGPSTPITVAGTEAETFNVKVGFDRPAQPAPECRPLLVKCTSLAPGSFYLDGVRMRMIVLHTDLPPFVIQIIGQTQRDLDKVEAPALEVLRTLRIGAR